LIPSPIIMTGPPRRSVRTTSSEFPRDALGDLGAVAGHEHNAFDALTAERINRALRIRPQRIDKHQSAGVTAADCHGNLRAARQRFGDWQAGFVDVLGDEIGTAQHHRMIANIAAETVTGASATRKGACSAISRECAAATIACGVIC
jgi:hypothetical protein